MNDKWDRRFLELAEHIATWSKDPSTKVGAVLVRDYNLVVGLGYNGFPRGVDDLEERLSNREYKYPMIVHAEVNAVIMAGNKAEGATLYCIPTLMVPTMCSECCKVCIQAGVRRVVGWKPTRPLPDKWRLQQEIVETMCIEAGVEFDNHISK